MASRQAGNPGMARVINDRMTLDLIAANGPISRSQIKADTGLSQPTVVDVVNRLEAAQLIVPAGEEGVSDRRGPRAKLYDIDARHGIVAGISVSGSTLHVLLADLRGDVLAEHSRPVDDSEPSVQILAAMDGVAQVYGCRADDITCATVGLHGQVDPRDGDLGFAWDLPGWQHRVIGSLRENAPCPVTLETDINLAALAETTAPPAAGLAVFAALWMGVGIGLSLISSGEPVRGVSGGAGQIGYMPVPGAPILEIPEAHDWHRGYQGGLQSLIGAEGLQRLAESHGLARDTAEETIATAVKDDSVVLDEYAGRVAIGLAAVSTIIDPGVFVLTGAVGYAGGGKLAERVEQKIAAICPVPARVMVTTHAGDTVVIGALVDAVARARDGLWGRAGTDSARPTVQSAS